MIKGTIPNLILKTMVHDNLFSYHKFVLSSVCHPRPPLTVTEKTFLKIRQIDSLLFHADLLHIIEQADDINHLEICLYSSSVFDIVNVPHCK